MVPELGTKEIYHGSFCEIKVPDLSRSREDIDFGVGFYLTKDYNMARKWAVTKSNSVVNSYYLDAGELELYVFDADVEWLEYIKANRGYGDNPEDVTKRYEKYDILIGPTADDKIFDTVQQYIDGYITADVALQYLSVAGFSDQIVLKTQRAVDNLKFVRSKTIFGAEKASAKRASRNDRIEANKKLDRLRETNRRREENAK